MTFSDKLIRSLLWMLISRSLSYSIASTVGSQDMYSPNVLRLTNKLRAPEFVLNVAQ